MKKIAFILFFVSGLMAGQEKIAKNLGDFTVLKTYRGLTVELIPAETPKIIIEGDKAKYVIVKNVNGVLKLSINILETFSAEDVMIYLHYAGNIDQISGNEGSVVKSRIPIKQEKITLKASEAAKIDVNIDVNYLDARSITGGIIKVEGSAINQKISGNTGGIFEGEGLESDYAEVNASTGAKFKVTAVQKIEATANIGSTIEIKGHPKQIVKKETLGGYVKDSQ